VRVQARNLRAQLEMYYSTVGRDDRIVISVAKGAYRASFTQRSGEPAESIGVRPFRVANPEDDAAHFASGLAEQIGTQLGRVGIMRVVAPGSMLAYADVEATSEEIARELNVSLVLSGVLGTSENRLDVSFELFSPVAGGAIYKGRLSQSAENCNDLSREIAEVIRPFVSPALHLPMATAATNTRPVCLAAYDAYFRARRLWGTRKPEAILAAVPVFEQAIHADPGFALAYAGLSDCLCMIGTYSIYPPGPIFEKARHLAKLAVELDPSLGEAHAAIAAVKALYEYDADGAAASFETAIEMAPSDATIRNWYAAFSLTPRCRWDEAIDQLERAISLDPFSAFLNTNLALTLATVGKYDEAAAYVRRAAKIDGESHRPILTEGLILEKQDQFGPALECYRKARSMARPETSGYLAVSSVGHALAKTGQIDAARAEVDNLILIAKSGQTRYVPPFAIAVIYAGLNDDAETLRWLETAVSQHNGGVLWLGADWRFLHLHGNVAFQSLVRRVGAQMYRLEQERAAAQ
jgi:TolB-like protein/tetratricopeptide (TPR) repeat protein